ncbi:MAG: hemerythrin domain-containing protein [Syntrophomonadaceae bacterium]
MDAIETLMSEHRVIERVIDGLVAFVEGTRRSGATDPQELSRFVHFIREFADACHHGKEEGILFAAMVEHGFPRQAGPIAVMLHEHDEGRAFVAVLAEKAAQQEPWSDEDRQTIADAAHGYAELLRAHIHKEDAILYPMAEQRLPPDALERVGEDCERFEQAQTGAGEHERLHALAEALVLRHAPASHPSPAPVQRHGCCG